MMEGYLAMEGLAMKAKKDRWTLPPSGVKKQPIAHYPIPDKVSLILSDLLYFEKGSYQPDCKIDSYSWQPFKILSFTELRQ